MALFLEVASLQHYCVERTVTLNEITQENNKVLRDKSNEDVKFHRLESSKEEAVSTVKSVLEAEQRNGGTQQKNTGRKRKPCQQIKLGTGDG